MKDSAVTLFLKNSKKGKLTYDRFWVEEGRIEKILNVNDDLTKLHHVSPRKLLEDSSSPACLPPTQADIGDCDFHIPNLYNATDIVDHSKEEVDLPTPASSVYTYLRMYEESRNKKVVQNVCNRRNMMDNNTEQNHRWAEQQMQHIRQKIEFDIQKRANNILLEREKEQQEVRERQETQKERLKTKARKLHDGKKEAEARQRQIDELQQQKKREQLEMRTNLVDIQKEFSEVAKDIIECLQTNRDNKWLRVEPASRGQKVKEVGNRMNHVLLECKDTEVNLKTVQEAQSTLHEIKSVLKDIQDDIAQAIVAREAEEAKAKLAVVEEVQEVKEAKAKDEGKTEKTVSETTALYQYISPSNLQHYVHVIEHQQTWEKKYKPLVDDISLKKYRFDLQKAVNTPVNAISGVSGAHLQDKIRRLSALLSGEMVTVGNKRVTCKSHEHGYRFCMDLVAKKLVSQAETQIPSNHEAAFPLAAVAVSLLVKFPELKMLLLASIYIKCPYLVPYYIPKKEDQSQVDHYSALGYLHIDGAIEKQDQFLKRMSGIARFYGAMLHTTPMPGLGATHPHGVYVGWKFLSCILNLRPRVDITATVIFDVLDVAGNAMFAAYGKQFRKLLHVLCKDYFQEVEKVTPGGSGGPLSRLQGFLQNVVRSGSIASPVGALTPGFWNTR